MKILKKCYFLLSGYEETAYLSGFCHYDEIFILCFLPSPNRNI